MTPQIALDLSLDAITVLSRAPEGGWWREGTVRLSDDDMPERMAALRDVARRRAGPDFTSILVLPDSQLLYTSVERDDRRPDETIRAMLRGRTPYEVADLTWDHVARGDRLQVAVVALDTLMEAESFAAEYGFRPVAVVASPSNDAFPGIPDFGKTGLAGDLLNGATLDLQVADGFRAIAAPTLPPEPFAETKVETDAASDDETLADAEASAKTEAPDTSPEPDPVPTPVTFRHAGPTRTAEPEPELQTEAETETDATPETVQEVEPEAAEATELKPLDAAAAFVTARRGAPTGEAPQDSGDRFARIAPRLTATPGPVTLTRGAAATPLPSPADVEVKGKRTTRYPDLAARPARPAEPPLTAAPKPEPVDAMVALRAAAQLKDAPPEARAARPKVPPLSPPGSLAARIKQRAAEEREAKALVGDDKDEAVTLARPGLARDLEANAKRGGTRLGLALTLVLLALLVIVGVGAAFMDDTPRPLAEEPAVEDRVPATLRTDVATAPVAGGAEPEIALLPAPGSVTEGATGPGTIAAPTPIATPVLARSVASADKAEALVGNVTAPGLAAAPTFETAPTAETTPAIFIEQWMADGDFTAPEALVGPATRDAPEFTVAGLDPNLLGLDLPGRPETGLPPEAPGRQLDPPPPELIESRDAALGLIAATEEGVVAPGGYGILLGRPDTLPRPRPGGAAEARLAALSDVPEAPAPELLLPAAVAPDAGLTDADPEAVIRAPEPILPEAATAPSPTPTDTDDAVAALPDAQRAEPIETALVPEPGTASEEAPEPEAGIETAALAPEIAEPAAPTEAELILRRVRPVERPEAISDDAVETAARLAEEAAVEEAALAARSAEEEVLRRLLPRQRPDAIVAASAEAERQAAEIAAIEAAAIEAAQQAAAASLASVAVAAQAGTVSPNLPTSALALPQSERPATRPRSVERAAAQIVTQRRQQASTAASAPATAPTPQAESSGQQIRSAGGNVARAATEQNVLRLNQINLIGVYGRPDARRALVRLANGRYVKVQVGDRLDRGRVTAIGDDRLRYQRGSRNMELRLPQV